MIRLGCILSILLIFSCKKPAENVIHLNKESFSSEEEKTIGATLKETILKLPEEFPVLDKTDYRNAYDYVSTLFKMLINTGKVTLRNDFDWDVTIIYDDDWRSAFITPGGHFFIYTGLLKTLNTESELVSVFAHEIYYAEKGYVVKRLKEEYSDLADILLENVDPPFLEELARDMNYISFPPSEVNKADDFAINLLCPFQYDATGLKSILDIADTSGTKIDWLSIRPGIENRKDEILNMAKSCGEEESTFSDRYRSFKMRMIPD
jgi:hypothetical protein